MPNEQENAPSEDAIDDLIARKFGKGAVQTVSIYYVLENAWGDDFFWTLEQRAQFSDWTIRYFADSQWDILLSSLPPQDAISQEEAIRLAWNAVSEAEGLPSNREDTEFLCSVSYGVGRVYAADYPPYYTVTFGIPLAEPDEEREPVTPYYQCSVSNLGEVMDSSYFAATPSSLESNGEASSDFAPLSYGDPFGAWDLERKAEFSAEWKPLVDEYLQVHPNYRGFYYYETRHLYGLPREDDVSQDRATELAKVAAGELGASEDYLSRAEAHYYFDVTDASKPLWKVYFSTIFSGEAQEKDALGYFVALSAKMGEVVEARIYEQGMALEDFR